MIQPKLQKIVVNTSFGRLTTTVPGFDEKVLPELKAAFAIIVGQAPQPRPTRKSIAGFKTRDGMIIGLKATLRRDRMDQFLKRVVSIVLPRIRDFKGIPLKNVDQGGNLTFGIKEHIVFPEVVLEDTKTVFGIQITLVPTTKLSREDAIAYYRKLGVPLKKSEETKKKK